MSVGVYQFPTSYGQRRMWLLGQLDPDEPTYNIGWALWLDGPLDLAALEQAWTAALTRHEALRTTFADESGVPVQVIEEEPAGQSIELSSVEQLPVEEREQAARTLIRQLAATPMALDKGPLVRLGLVRLAEQRHVLAVVVHHIVADGWSFRLLFDELSTDYEAIRRTGEPAVPEPAIQYADFALWQLEHADQGGFSQAERFWRNELAGAPSTLPLPTDRPYPSRQSFAADGIDAGIDEQLAGALRQVAGQHGGTLFAALLACYALVLTRLTGQREVLVAVPMAARTRPETESVVGLFMNTVTIRVVVDERQRLGELVRSVHAATARALAQQELPFARVVELARPDREPTRLPLVQVMFALEQSWAVPDRGGLTWRPELIENGTAKFELELTVTDDPAGPRLRLNYNTAVFDRSTGQLAVDSFQSVLRLLAEQPELPLAELQPWPAELYRQVRDVWSDAGPVPDPDATMLSRLWQACDTDAVLAEGSDGTLTGRQIRDRAAVLAAALREHGVRPTDRVALLLPRGARLLPAILGVWATGACYLPLDPIYPEQRLRTMLADADVRAIVIDSAVPDAPVPPGTSVPVLDLATLAEPSDQPVDRSAEPLPDLPPAAPAYVLFTSGSTGRPKAVSVPHGALAALLDATKPMFALGPSDLMVSVATFAFDIAQLELLAPVLAGARVLVAETEHSLDAGLLRRLLISTGATALQSTPTGWRMLVEAGGVPDGVTLRISGGEPLARDLADEIGRGPGVRLWNLYGPTETTIYSAGWLAEPSPVPLQVGSIIGGNQHYLLDAELRPVPPGVLGEVYIGGACLANGYHGAPDLTASKFLPNPFSGRPGDRLYRSGDLGRWNSDGRIELAGRIDRQVKIRGYRVESGEVEAALRAHPEIAEAVVSVRGGGHDVRLVGYLVTRDGASEPPADLRARLHELLPDYMVPAGFVVLNRLPLTANGKLDHRALPEPDWAAGSGAAAPTAPRNPVESQLAALFAEVLALPQPVGVTDNFFALGGHSLTATRLMTRVRDAYGVDLPLRRLFADPTVAGLAGAVAAATGDRG